MSEHDGPTVEVPVNEHHGVGPHIDVYDHGPVTIITDGGDDPEPEAALCLDCGYVVNDIRLLLHADCDRENNPINSTWREALDDDVFPTGAGE